MTKSYKPLLVKAVLYLLGLCGGLVFLISKSPTALGWSTAQSWEYGDLYRMAKVARFKPPAPLGAGIKRNVDSIDLGIASPQGFTKFFFGDSFGYTDCGDGSLFRQVEEKSGTPVYGIYNLHHVNFFTHPQSFFSTFQMEGTGAKVLILEVAERSLLSTFGSAPPEARPAQTGMVASFGAMRDALFHQTEQTHEVFFKHSRWTWPVVEAWNSTVFEIFGQISRDTPAYSLSPPFLFYAEEISPDYPRHFYPQHDSDVVLRIVANIVQLRDDLRSQFQCELVFFPVPNKSTVYGYLATQEQYDDFLPRLYAALKDKGVQTVEVLPLFKAEKRLLYYPTDTHWNRVGLKIAVDQTLKTWVRK